MQFSPITKETSPHCSKCREGLVVSFPAPEGTPTEQLQPLKFKEHYKRGGSRKVIRARDQRIFCEIVLPRNDREVPLMKPQPIAASRRPVEVQHQ